MNALFDTLFYNIQNDPYLNKCKDVFVINYSVLGGFEGSVSRAQTFFACVISNSAEPSHLKQPDFPDSSEKFDLIVILIPKNSTEAKYLIAQSLQFLTEDGWLICCGENKAGGNRLKKIYQSLGFQNIHDDSRNKSKCVWAQNTSLNEQAINEMKGQGALQFCEDIGLYSQPGIFGWNKIDVGSKLLLDHLPETLRGNGADFGCGYGFLSHQILNANQNKIDHLYCVDIDYRAVEASRKNLENHENTSFIWHDLTNTPPDLPKLDFIIMNPPFHSGKKTDIALGQSIIETAQQSLKKGGYLYTVANAHLPYEKTLNTLFETVEARAEEKGFKIFAVRK